jgi:hypothetical protein
MTGGFLKRTAICTIDFSSGGTGAATSEAAESAPAATGSAVAPADDATAGDGPGVAETTVVTGDCACETEITDKVRRKRIKLLFIVLTFLEETDWYGSGKSK